MGKAGKKPRKKMDVKNVDGFHESKPKQERDWTFEDIVRSKPHRR